MVFDYKENRRRAKNHNAENWFQYRRDYVTSGLMTRNEAMFISDVANHSQGVGAVLDRYGFFLCMTGYLLRSLCWSPSTQKELFASLRRKKLVHVRRGRGACRWVRINYIAIDAALDAASPDATDDADGTEIRPKGKAIGRKIAPSNGRKIAPSNGRKIARKEDISKKTEKGGSAPRNSSSSEGAKKRKGSPARAERRRAGKEEEYPASLRLAAPVEKEDRKVARAFRASKEKDGELHEFPGLRVTAQQAARLRVEGAPDLLRLITVYARYGREGRAKDTNKWPRLAGLDDLFKASVLKWLRDRVAGYNPDNLLPQEM